MLTEKLAEQPPDRPISLRNRNCIYCGAAFHANSEKTREHVIGRQFVPDGFLAGQWNLIAWACRPCNSRKAELEDDLSLITMVPDLAGPRANADPRLLERMRRKADGAMSRRTGRRVRDSHETITMTMPFGPATFTFTAVAPPQAEQHRVYELAMFHVQAFFYLITYKEESRTGSRFPGRFAPAIEARRSDWGNGVMLGFIEAQRSWRRRILAVGADRFFKLSIRRHPENADIWAWAVEWNQNFRVAGYFGEENLVRAAVRALPPLTVQTFAEGNGNWVRSRLDVELPEDQDRLFFDDDLDQPDYGEEQAAVTEDVGPTTSAEAGPSTPAS